MITKYINFINENWQIEVEKKAIDISKNFLDKEEIEDVFLDLIESGFEIVINDGLYGYVLGNKFHRTERKSDIGRYECYPFFHISIKGKNTSSSTFDKTHKTLDYYKMIIDKVKLGLSRLLHTKLDKVELVDTSVDYGKYGITLSFYLKINKRISPLETISKYKPPKTIFDTLLDILNNNKLFTVIQFGVTGKIIEIEVKGEYKDRDIEPILTSMFKKFEGKVTYETMDPSPRLGNKRYRVIINE